MSNVLDEILAHKRGEVEQAKAAHPIDELRAMAGYIMPRRNFYGAVTVPRAGEVNLIAEIKRSSPSAGLIRPDFDPAEIAGIYEEAGAQALSVLTDEAYFGGSPGFIEQVKAAVGLPVLRKDFLVDPYQVHESRAYGADAVLVIADALEFRTMVELVTLSRELEMWVLLEVHTRGCLLDILQKMQKELANGVLLGINNRDLQAQKIDLGITEQLARLIPPGLPVVAESGIRTRRDVARMHAAGARALLIGETFMRADDIGAKVRELFA